MSDVLLKASLVFWNEEFPNFPIYFAIVLGYLQEHDKQCTEMYFLKLIFCLLIIVCGGSGNGRVTFCGKSQEQLLDTLSYFVLSAVRKFKTASMQSLILVKLVNENAFNFYL